MEEPEAWKDYKKEEQIPLSVGNGDKIYLPKFKYIKYLEQLMERELKNENYEECNEIKLKLEQYK